MSDDEKDLEGEKLREVLRKYGQPEEVDRETQREIEHAEIKPTKEEPAKESVQDIGNTLHEAGTETQDLNTPEKNQEISDKLNENQSVLSKYGQEAPAQEEQGREEQQKDDAERER